MSPETISLTRVSKSLSAAFAASVCEIACRTAWTWLWSALERVLADDRVDGVDAGCPPLDHRSEVVAGHFVPDELGVGGVACDVVDLEPHLDVGLGVVLHDFAERRGHDAAEHVLGVGGDGVADLGFAEGVGYVDTVPLLGLPAFQPSSNLFLLCHGITSLSLSMFQPI
jgi:hypothetical protein